MWVLSFGSAASHPLSLEGPIYATRWARSRPYELRSATVPSQLWITWSTLRRLAYLRPASTAPALIT